MGEEMLLGLLTLPRTLLPDRVGSRHILRIGSVLLIQERPGTGRTQCGSGHMVRILSVLPSLWARPV